MKKLAGDLAELTKFWVVKYRNSIKQGEIKGKSSEVTIIHSLGKIPAGRVAIIGLGKSKELTSDKIRIAVADACRALRKKGAKHIEVVFSGYGGQEYQPGDFGSGSH